MGTGIGTGAAAGMMVGSGGGGVGGHGGVGVSSESLKRPEKPLRELLEEQDIGKTAPLNDKAQYLINKVFLFSDFLRLLVFNSSVESGL